MIRKLPIGIQGFEKLRTDHFLYVDKTEYIYRLAQNNVPYFLSRPRRFGKSLLLSAMKYYFEGRADLFKGLAIEKLEDESENPWQSYPVFYFDFNGANYQNESALEHLLDEHLQRWERNFRINISDKDLGKRFRNLIREANDVTGKKVVILIDEYDKPFMDVADNEKLQDHNKEVFKGFFSTLKSHDEYIQFIFITGVSKFHKVSIFSDLNHLKDISLSRDYAALCGITEEELHAYFMPEIWELAKEQELDETACLKLLKEQYDGYHFSADGKGVYNPFSVLNALFDRSIGSYWYETGTPTFLIKRLKQEMFDLWKFTDQTIYADERVLKDYTGDSSDPIPLLYQTGYLTIASYDRMTREYTLTFPNAEVKYGFMENLLPEYVPGSGSGSGKDIFTLRRYIEQGNLDQIRQVLTALFAGIPYTLESDPFEHYFQSVIYLVFTLLGKFTVCEMHTFSGRIDCKVETSRFIYLFEFKRDQTAEEALKQINDKQYALPFAADGRTIYKIGVAFDSKTRMLSDWIVEEGGI